MQIRELVELGAFLKEFIQTQALSNQYTELINAINQAAQNQNVGQVDTFYKKLIQTHQEAEKQILSPAQSKLLSDYGAENILGHAAITRIENIFNVHRAHTQGMTNALQELLNETNQLVKRSNQLVAVLEPLIEEYKLDEEELGENEGRLWLYFSEDTSVNTIEDLEDTSETWKQILHNFSRMPNAAMEGARIIQMRKHSPLELELAANLALLVPLGYGIQWVLERISDVIKICQEAEKLKQMNVKTQIIKDLYKDAEDQRKAIAKDAAEEIKNKFGTDNEVRTAVKQALTKVITFIENGGLLDIDIGDTENSDEENETDETKIELKGFIENIRKDIKLLPSSEEKSDDDDTDAEEE